MLPLLRALSKDQEAAIEQLELRGLVRNSSDGAWLLIVLAGVYLLTPGAEMIRPLLMLATLALFVAFSLLLRFLPRFRRQPRQKIMLELIGMVLLTSVFLYSIDTHASLLLILYLLPVIIGALTLGRRATLVVTLLSVTGFLLAALLRDTSVMPTGRELVELGIALVPFLLVSYVTASLAHGIATARQRIRTLAETDELTGLCNMRAFSRLHRQEHERASRHQRRYSIIVMDLDGLQHINDSYGQQAGDRAIVLCANVIARLIRSTDAAARVGSDEFVILLSETAAEQATRVSHRLRSAVERCTIEAAGRMLRLAVSVGTASFPDDSEDPRELIAAADRAMDRDKQGRQQGGRVAARATPQAELV
jgi:diguanylate cyclase (GGDEF)-like protein